MKKLKGKYLVRKSKLEDGTPVVTLTGVFHANFNIDEISDSDEMWVSELTVEGGIKFTNPISGHGACSPEEFLEGDYQSPSQWKNKEEL